MSTLQSKVAAESPRLKQDTGVAANDRILSAPWQRWLMKDLKSALFPEALAYSTSALGSVWDPTSLYTTNGSIAVNNLWNGGGSSCGYSSSNIANDMCTNGEQSYESLKDWMGQAMNPQFTNSNGASTTVFGRLAHAAQVGCVIGLLVPSSDLDADGLPKVGTFSITFPSDTSNAIYQSTNNGGCAMSTSMAGATLSPTVTAVSGSALFTKEMTVSVPGGNPSSMYLKLDSASGVFNYMEVEDERPQGREQVSRTIAVINGQKTMFEYISLGSPITAGQDSQYPSAYCVSGGQNQCGYEFYRIYIDDSADQAFLLSNYGASDESGYTRFTAAGKPNEIGACNGGSSCGSTVALSLGIKGYPTVSGGGTTTSFITSASNDYIGCVDAGSGAVSTDDSLSCDLTGTTVSAATAIDGEWSLYQASVVNTLLANTGASTTLAFTGPSDFFTAVPTQ